MLPPFDRKKLAKDVKASGLMTGFLCAKAGIHRSYLWMILKGVRQPTEEVVKRIYEALGIK